MSKRGGSTGFDLKAIVRANIASLEPYRCARDDYSEGILLDANENSLGSTSTKHVDLELNRYPDPLYYNIKEHIAKFRAVQKEQIFLGVGSDEAIDILFRVFCVPGIDNVVICPPTYGTLTLTLTLTLPLSLTLIFTPTRIPTRDPYSQECTRSAQK